MHSDLPAAVRVPTIARNALSPLLEELIDQLHAEGRSTERACFRRIKVRLDDVRDDSALLASLAALASTEAFGYARSAEAQALLLRLLEKASTLAEILDRTPDQLH